MQKVIRDRILFPKDCEHVIGDIISLPKDNIFVHNLFEMLSCSQNNSAQVKRDTIVSFLEQYFRTLWEPRERETQSGDDLI